MKFKNRKLKFEDDGEPRSIVSLSMPADFIIYAPPLQAAEAEEAAAAAAAAVVPPLANTKSSTARSRIHSSKEPSPGFESSMALTIFILLAALFFMGFFSVYFRCVNSGRRSRRAANLMSNSRLQQLAASSLSSNNLSKDDDQGLDPITIGSLPILPYNSTTNYIMSSSSSSSSSIINNGGCSGGGEEGLILRMLDDCVVCLCEYEEGEMVKVIPYCGHLFHPECIDLWFISHSSCPLCRSKQLFPPTPTTPTTPEKKKKKNNNNNINKKQHPAEEKEEDDESMKSRVVVVLRKAYSFSGGKGNCSSDYSSSSSLLGDNERLVMLKRSSSWSSCL